MGRLGLRHGRFGLLIACPPSLLGWGANAVAVAVLEFQSVLCPFFEQRRHCRQDQLIASLFVRAKAVQYAEWNR